MFYFPRSAPFHTTPGCGAVDRTLRKEISGTPDIRFGRTKWNRCEECNSIFQNCVCVQSILGIAHAQHTTVNTLACKSPLASSCKLVY